MRATNVYGNAQCKGAVIDLGQCQLKIFTTICIFKLFFKSGLHYRRKHKRKRKTQNTKYLQVKTRVRSFDIVMIALTFREEFLEN